MLIFLLFIFNVFTIQYICNLCKDNVLLLINFVGYLFICSLMYTSVFLHFVVLSMYNVCLCYIHCLSVISNLAKPKCWVPINYVYWYCKILQVFASRWLVVVILVYVFIALLLLVTQSPIY